MVQKDKINDNIDKAIFKLELQDIVEKRVLEIIKCGTLNAIKRASNPQMGYRKQIIKSVFRGTSREIDYWLTNYTGYGTKNKHDLTSMRWGDYKDGTLVKVDLRKGEVSIDGENFKLGFDGEHLYPDQTNEIFGEPQKEYIIDNYGDDKWEMVKKYSNLLSHGSTVFKEDGSVQYGSQRDNGENHKILNDLIKKGVDFTSKDFLDQFPEDTPIGYLGRHYFEYNELCNELPIDTMNFAVVRTVPVTVDKNKANVVDEYISSYQVNKPSDKLCPPTYLSSGQMTSFKEPVFDENWTEIVLVREGSGATGLYSSLARIEGGGVHPSGDAINRGEGEINFGSGTEFHKLLQDNENKVLIKEVVVNR